MKAIIHITGQPFGNIKILSAINNGDYRRGMFNSYYIDFESVGDAKKAMRSAWKHIKQHNNTVWHDGPSKDLKTLHYDASVATILTNH